VDADSTLAEVKAALEKLPDGFLTKKEVARMFRVTPRTIRDQMPLAGGGHDFNNYFLPQAAIGVHMRGSQHGV
jgi:hypothetical protein